MAEELKTLIAKRGQIKAKVSRFRTFIENAERNSNKSQLKNRLDIFKISLTEFDSLQSQIEIVDTQTDHNTERETFESSYFDLLERADILLSSDEPSNSNSNSIEKQQNNIQVKLPTIQLPTFGGKYEDWLQFEELFNSVIDSNQTLTDIQKFYYLKSSLQGPALNVLESLEVSASNYRTAWELLSQRFNNKRVIVNNHVNAIFEISKLERESGSALRSLLDILNKHLRALKSLGQPVDQWDTLLLHIITKKLDYNSIKLWEGMQQTTSLPNFSDLTKFLEGRCNVLEAVSNTKSSLASKPTFSRPLDSKGNNQSYKKPQHNSSYLSSVSYQCPSCKGPHKMYQCPKFSKMSVNERMQCVKKLGVCINCLSKNHLIKDCFASKCRICGKKHNSLLHFDTTEKTPQESSKSSEDELSSTTLAVGTRNQILLSTAVVDVIDVHGASHQCRVLLDSGSQSNFITEKMADKLKLKILPSNTSIIGIGQCQSTVAKSVECTISSRHNSYKTTIRCLILPRITNDMPSIPIDVSGWNLTNINLADPQFCKSSSIDMLVGAEVFFNILSVGQFRPVKSGPIFQKTSLGWIASGKVQTKKDAPKHSLLAIDSMLHNQVKKFWELEECVTPSTPTCSNEEDHRCEQHYVKTTTRDEETGRYTVELPLKENISELGDSLKIAESRFFQIERKLAQNPDLHKSYVEFMDEYEKLGHMEIVDLPDFPNKSSYFIPHLAVTREESSTTKTRVVFDASAKTSSGLSLNDTLMVGPTIQCDVFSIICRFRLHTFALTADIEKMYRQINIHPKHQDLQKILWRKNTSEPVRSYRLKTVTYGTASAPFLAIRTLKELAEDEEDLYPLASKILKEDFYVDDLLTGTDSEDEAKAICFQLQKLLEKGCFNLRKWSSNSQEVLQSIPIHSRATSTDKLGNKQFLKILGMQWCAETDTFHYSIKCAPQTIKITKRSVLAEIASLFDPLGLLGPIILRAKLFLQTLWQLKLTWDESLPAELHCTWQNYRQQLADLKHLSIPRRIKASNTKTLELHGFCDASERAYGACIYVRSINIDGKTQVSLIASKSRVSPLKATTIPRLELCGALLLANLFDKIVSLGIPFDSCSLWSDSTIVLAWIKSPSTSLKIFVGNRVSQIQQRTENKCSWNHVRTAHNPADLISRGASTTQLMGSKSLWWHGPDWLMDSPENWPKTDVHEVDNLPEMKTPLTSLTSLVEEPIIDISRFSSLVRAQRVTAWCFRFIRNLKISTKIQSIHGPLDPIEIQEATTYLLRIEQQNHFREEYSRLKSRMAIKQNSKLLALRPFMDEKGLIRVGGRLKNASIPPDQKTPILLAPKSHLTSLIIKHEHLRHLHAAPQLLLASLRQKYWPLRGRETVRKIVHTCVVCFKAKPKFNQPQMGDLPSSRSQVVRPFTNTGTDLCGPIYIKASKRRNSQRIKGYIVLFVCMSTKAIHLELVSDMSTQSFLAAFKRFVSRRGICANIYSDNGTNFVGAKNEIQELKNLFLSQTHQRKIIDEAAALNIKWHFIPPRSPHFGGLWEAGVKAVKHHLRRVVAEASLTFEELYTTLTSIEACVNSRPLTPLSSDPHDLTPLTPGHFLTGSPLTAIPEPSLRHLQMNRLSHWQRVQQITEHFWTRWSKEYLSSLQQLPKWTRDTTNVKVGQLVVVREDNVPPTKWITARVTDVHPGADGRVRVATIMTSSGTFKRSVNRLCVLPIEDAASDQ